MKRSLRLSEWLADRSARRESGEKAKAFAMERRRGETAWYSEYFDRLEDAGAEGVAERVERLFCNSLWLDEVIAAAVAASREDPFFTAPLPHLSSDIHRGFAIFEDPRLFMAISVISLADLAAKKTAPRGKTSIGFTGRLTVLKFVKAGGVRLSFWEAPPIGPDFTAATAGRCVRAGERTMADGDILVVDGRCQSYVIEHTRSNLFVLQAEILVDQAPLSVEYDSATGEYVGCSATDDRASRIQMIATLLRRLDCDAAIPAMTALLDHQDFFVRWHVMRELLGLDAEAALPHLRHMASRDRHPETREAARVTLDYIEGVVAERKAA